MLAKRAATGQGDRLSLLEMLSAGMTIAAILDAFEDLERDDVLATLEFATRITQVKRIQPNAA